MSFLIDEFTPQSYEGIFFHRKIYDSLKKMSDDNTVPHIIFHGEPGSGLKTMVYICLKMIYGDSINNLYYASHKITGSGNKTKIETVENSDNHIIINPTGTNFDRYLVHEIVKNYAGNRTFDLLENPNSKFRTIQISNLDKLSHSAQTSLRRMIEVNASTCRFITWCNNLSNVIGPLTSRCVCIRVPRPTIPELFAYLVYVSLKKQFNLSMEIASDIVDKSDCNIKYALWCLQLHMCGLDYKTKYDIAIANIYNLILTCNISNIDLIRTIFFNIMITNFEGEEILKSLERIFIESDELDETSKINIILKCAEIEYNTIRGRRNVIHFDCFVSQVMQIIKYSVNGKKIMKRRKGKIFEIPDESSTKNNEPKDMTTNHIISGDNLDDSDTDNKQTKKNKTIKGIISNIKKKKGK